MWMKPVLHPVILLIKFVGLVVSFLLPASYLATITNFHSDVCHCLAGYLGNRLFNPLKPSCYFISHQF
jgi:hypothetical protein